MPSAVSKPADNEPDHWLLHFQIQEKIGKGAFGTVWKARDSRLDRSVAIKIPRKSRIAQYGGEAFLREARAVAQLKHPNIVPVFEVGKKGDVYYIVSDFIEGVGLDEWMRDHRPNPKEAAILIAKIADALDHAHKNGIVHRDLKPTNILIDAAGEPHIMDFGLAKRQDEEPTRNESGRLIGTPLYMAPEQARGESFAADARTDIYALGVVFFELLTGQPPFHGTMRVLLDQILYEDAPSPRRLDKTIPRDVETICLKCLQKNRKRRYQAASEVAFDLRRWLKHEPIEARATPGWEKWLRWSQRNRLAAGLSALLVIISLMSLIHAIRQRMAIADQRGQADNARIQSEQASKERKEFELKTQNAVAGAAAAQYTAKFLLGFRQFQLGDAHSAVSALQASRRETPNWEWNYLARQCNASSNVVGLSALPMDVAFSWRGTRAAVLCDDRSVTLIDLGNSQIEAKWKYQGAPPAAIDWCSGDTALALAVGADVAIVQAKSGKLIDKLATGGKPIIDLASDEAGVHFAARSMDARLQIWNASTRKRLWQSSPNRSVRSVAFHPILEQLAVGFDDGGVGVYSSANGKELQTAEGSGAVIAVGFAENGVGLWWLAGGNVFSQMRPGGITNATPVAVGPIACATFVDTVGAIGDTTGNLTVMDPKTRQPRLRLAAHRGSVRQAAPPRKGNKLVTVGADNQLRIWKIDSEPSSWTWEDQLVDGSTTELVSLDFSSDGESLVTVGRTKSGLVRRGDTGEARPGGTFEVKGELSTACLNATGDRIALGAANTIEIRPIRGLDATTFLQCDGVPMAIRFSPTGKWLAAALGKKIGLWHIAQNAPPIAKSLEGHVSDVAALTFSSDDRRLFSGDVRGNVLVWKIEDPSVVQREQTVDGDVGPVVDMQYFASDDRLFIAGEKSVQVVKLPERTVVQSIGSNLARVRKIGLNQTGTRLATTGDDAMVRIWDTASGHEIFVVGPLPSAGVGVAFSNKGSLAVGCVNGVVKVFNGRE